MLTRNPQPSGHPPGMPHLVRLGLLVLLATGIFLLDLSLPLGVAGGVPYVAVVLLALWLPRRRYTLLAAFACTGLTILGFFYFLLYSSIALKSFDVFGE